MVVPKLSLTPIKIRILAQKRPNLVQNLHFWSFRANYCHFLHILSNARPKNNVNKVPSWVFRYAGNKTFDFSSKNLDFLPKNEQIWPEIGIFCSIWARPCRLIWCPVGGSVGGCGARAVSRETPIYFILSTTYLHVFKAVHIFFNPIPSSPPSKCATVPHSNYISVIPGYMSILITWYSLKWAKHNIFLIESSYHFALTILGW